MEISKSDIKTDDKNRTSPAQENNAYKTSGRVLVAEDSPTNQTLIRILLKKLGLESTIVENGKLAVEKIAAEDFDVVLMDMQMPVMNGYEATIIIKQSGVDIPVIALTANAMKGDDQKCYDAGCDAYLTKPIGIQKLFDTLNKYLEESKNKKQKVSEKTEAKKMIENNPQNVTDVNNVPCSIDWSLVMSRVGDEMLLDEILPVFIKDSTERMRMLTDAVASGDLKEIKFYAHSLKGASAIVGASKFSDIARDLETASREEKAETSNSLFVELEKAFDELIKFVAIPDWKQIAKQHANDGESVR